MPHVLAFEPKGSASAPSCLGWPARVFYFSPSLGVAIHVPQERDHLLFTADFGVLQDVVPHHAGGSLLLTATEQVGHGVSSALDVGAA